MVRGIGLMLHSTTQDNPQGLPFLESEDRNSFREFLKPRIAKLLAAFRLDATFHRPGETRFTIGTTETEKLKSLTSSAVWGLAFRT